MSFFDDFSYSFFHFDRVFSLRPQSYIVLQDDTKSSCVTEYRANRDCGSFVFYYILLISSKSICVIYKFLRQSIQAILENKKTTKTAITILLLLISSFQPFQNVIEMKMSYHEKSCSIVSRKLSRKHDKNKLANLAIFYSLKLLSRQIQSTCENKEMQYSCTVYCHCTSRERERDGGFRTATCFFFVFELFNIFIQLNWRYKRVQIIRVCVIHQLMVLGHISAPVSYHSTKSAIQANQAFSPDIANFIIHHINCAKVKPSILIHEFTNSCILKGNLSEQNIAKSAHFLQSCFLLSFLEIILQDYS